MLNITNRIVLELTKLNLSQEEAIIYIELLQSPNTHLQLSHLTGINRTRVYRIIQSLEERSLVARRTDDRGTFLTASDPRSLEVELVNQEEKLKQQKTNFLKLLPTLENLKNEDNRAFTMRTFEGEAGMKQMCWNELKTKDNLLSLGNGTIEQIVSDNRWANKHREYQIAAGYNTFELINYDYSRQELPDLASDLLIKSKLYKYKLIPPEVISFESQTIVYNNVVAIYHWKQDQKVGVEIICSAYAEMMRQIFYFFWNMDLRSDLKV